MGLADDVARHNQATASYEKERDRHRLLHTSPKGSPAKSCRFCREVNEIAKVEAMVRAGKLVRG